MSTERVTVSLPAERAESQSTYRREAHAAGELLASSGTNNVMAPPGDQLLTSIRPTSTHSSRVVLSR
jgi:hypothetical protein